MYVVFAAITCLLWGGGGGGMVSSMDELLQETSESHLSGGEPEALKQRKVPVSLCACGRMNEVAHVTSAVSHGTNHLFPPCLVLPPAGRLEPNTVEPF